MSATIKLAALSILLFPAALVAAPKHHKPAPAPAAAPAAAQLAQNLRTAQMLQELQYLNWISYQRAAYLQSVQSQLIRQNAILRAQAKQAQARQAQAQQVKLKLSQQTNKQAAAKSQVPSRFQNPLALQNDRLWSELLWSELLWQLQLFQLQSGWYFVPVPIFTGYGIR